MAEKALKQPEVFIWTGTDKRGVRVKGQTRGSNPTIIKADLRKQGITPLKIKKQSSLFSQQKKKKITAKDIAVFFRQLATMMSAGVPLVQAFEIIGRGHDNVSMRNLILKIKSEVESGTSLSETLAKHPIYFDELVVNLVNAGEQAGVLEALLDKIATYKEKTEYLKAKIKKAMFYPAAVIVVAIIVTSILLIFVVPQFEQLFTSFGADLPAFTRLVVNLSEFMQDWWWVVFGIAIGAVVGILQAKRRSREFSRTLDRIILKLPIVGTIMHKASVARYARTLSTMFAAGVPLVEALESVAGATGNVVYSDAVLMIRDSVERYGGRCYCLPSSLHIFAHINNSLVQLTLQMQQASLRRHAPGWSADFGSGLRNITVGSSELVKIGSEAVKQEQYGTIDIIVYSTLEEALQHARKEIKKG